MLFNLIIASILFFIDVITGDSDILIKLIYELIKTFKLGEDIINTIKINLIKICYKNIVTIIINIKLLKSFIITLMIIDLLKICDKDI